jgi:hypothetical protein
MSEQARHDITNKRVVYDVPGAEAVMVRRDIEFRAADGGVLAMDLYDPGDSKTEAPAVIIVGGYADPGCERILGCKFKEMASSISWGRLIAASGIVAITYTNREPAGDLDALLEHVRHNAAALGIDENRIGVWASSGNVPLAMSVLMGRGRESVKCAVLCYGYMLDLEGATAVGGAARTFGFVNPCAGKSVDDLPPHVPLFIARAGQDQMPGLNETLDRFVVRALSRDLPLTLINHTGAPHAFDLFHDSETSREIIRRILGFLQFHLGVAPIITPHESGGAAQRLADPRFRL